MQPDNFAIMVVGMHRSGTSFVAGSLQKAGVDMGDELIRGDISNPEGHFENVEVVKLHDQVLDDHNAPLYPQKQIQNDYSQVHKAACNSIIQSHTDSAVWGWKDPRGSLMLPLWIESLPGKRFVVLVVFRDPLSTVRSLLRRDWYNTKRKVRRRYQPVWYFQKRLLMKSVTRNRNSYLQSWIVHYKEIMQSVIELGHPYLLMHFPDLFNTDWISRINAQFDLGLSSEIKLNDTKSKIRSTPMELKFDPNVQDEAYQLYSDLLELSKRT